MKIPIKRLHEDLVVPNRQRENDAGLDCKVVGFSRIVEGGDDVYLVSLETDDCIISPLERMACKLGFATAIPKGYYFRIVPRSGLALWNGLTILNTPATIDSGYRDEWVAIVINLSNKPIKIHKGDRICQIMLEKIIEYEFEEVKKLPKSKRGTGGFGSTGRG